MAKALEKIKYICYNIVNDIGVYLFYLYVYYLGGLKYA